MVAPNPKKQMPLTYRPTQAAQAIGCHVKEIYAAIEAKELPYRKGNFREGATKERYLIDASDLVAWVDKRFPKVCAAKTNPDPVTATAKPPAAKRKPRHKPLIFRKQDLL